MGVEVIMLTGDNAATAAAIARQVGTEQYEAQVLPDGKAERVVALKRAGKIVGMVGDGINDAPALAAAGMLNPVIAGAAMALSSVSVIPIHCCSSAGNR